MPSQKFSPLKNDNITQFLWHENKYLTRNRTKTRHPENTVAQDWYTRRSASCIRKPAYHIAAPLLTREAVMKKFV